MSDDHPKVLTYPPIIFGVGIALGYLIEWQFPSDVGIQQPWRDALGGLLVVLGAVLLFGAGLAMRQAHTSADPYKPSTALVTSGPFRVTRNPIYLAWLPLVAGISIFTGTIWPLIMMAPVYVVVDRFIVAPEEAYLAEKFGASYQAYREKVRRWL